MKAKCEKCGCTDENACFHAELGPCAWVDEERTLCTYCLPAFEYDSSIDRPFSDNLNLFNNNQL